MQTTFKFIALEDDLFNAWQKVFAGIENVEVISGSIFNYPSDAIVSPANSFGFMNGGIDFSISKHLGWHIEKKLQEKIRQKHYGELLVGQAEIVETGSELFPYLISAPTMRIPMTINGTPNAYLAMRAILLLIKYGKLDSGGPVAEKVRTIATPGLGTGIGQMAPINCARQMRIAWEDVMGEKHKTIGGWEEMRSNYMYFYTNDKSRITYDVP